MKLLLIYIGLLAVLLCGCGADMPQDAKALTQKQDMAQLKKYFFIKVAADTIVDPSESLKDFYQSLYTLATVTQDSLFLQVPIIHFGDSHIQAGYMTEVIRQRLQTVFGNAGRGLVVPLKLAGTNEPRDYTITGDGTYESTKILERNASDHRPGVTGISVYNPSPKQRFLVTVHRVPEDTLDYRFSKIVVFHDSLAPMITTRPEVIADTYGSDIFYSYTTEIELLNATDSIGLFTYPERQFSNGAFYGFSLENDRNGVLYHSLGVNGACYLHWGYRSKVAEQTEALRPELIMASMGANEAAGRNFVESVFYREVDSFVSKLRRVNPNAAILLIAPTEAMRRSRHGVVPNPNYARISKTLQQYAEEHDIAFFNMFNAMGGVNASLDLNANGLMQRDKLHFTPEGYKLQGLLIYNALLNGYNKYVREITKPANL